MLKLIIPVLLLVLLFFLRHALAPFFVGIVIAYILDPYVSFLEKIGEHTLAILSDTGTAATTFTIQAASKTPQTGDFGAVRLGIALMMVSGAILSASIVFSAKRRFKAR